MRKTKHCHFAKRINDIHVHSRFRDVERTRDSSAKAPASAQRNRLPSRRFPAEKSDGAQGRGEEEQRVGAMVRLENSMGVRGPARAHAIFQADAEESSSGDALDTVDSLDRRFHHRRLASTLVSSTSRLVLEKT